MKEELKWDDKRCKVEHARAVEFLGTMGLDTEKSRATFKSDEIVHFRDDFKALDLDGDGVVSTRDLRELFTHQGYPKVSEEILVSLISEVDSNRNGVVDFNEFLEVFVIVVQDATLIPLIDHDGCQWSSGSIIVLPVGKRSQQAGH